MILDSNLIIYAAKPEYPGLRRLIATHSPVVSVVSLIEVLGYHKLTQGDREQFEKFFAAARVLPISDAIAVRAVSLRQARKMSLDDALIAATALELGHELLTHNIKDYIAIPGLIASDPIAAGDPL